MSEQVKAKYGIYELGEDDKLILNPNYIIMNVHRKDADQLASDIAENPVLADELYDRCAANDKVQIVKLSSITKLHTAGKHKNTVTLNYVSKHSGGNLSIELPFFLMSEKYGFIKMLQNHTNNEFAYEERPASQWRAIWKSFQRLVLCAVICGIASYLAYYLENAEEYSLRVPAVIYPIVLAIQGFGSFWVFIVAGIITALFLYPFIKSLIIPNKEMTLTRIVDSSSVVS